MFKVGGRRQKADAVGFKFLDHDGQDRFGFLVDHFREKLGGAHIRNNISEELRVLHLPGHDGVRDAVVFEEINNFSQLTDGQPRHSSSA